MRLRFLWIDFFEESSKTAEQCYKEQQLHIPEPCVNPLPSAGLTTSICCWLLPRLVAEMPRILSCSSEFTLSINTVQVHFLSSIIPQKILWPEISHRKEEFNLESETRTCSPKHLNLDPLLHFERMALEMPEQDDLGKVIVSELSIAIGYASIWENQISNGSHDMFKIFEPGKTKEIAYKTCKTFTKYQPCHFLGLQDDVCKNFSPFCTDRGSIFEDNLRLKPSVLEVPGFDDGLTSLETLPLFKEFSAIVKEMAFQSTLLQLDDILHLLDTESRVWATRVFTLKFCEQLTWDRKSLQCQRGSFIMQSLNFLLLENSSLIFSSDCSFSGLPVLESTAPLWEIGREMTRWSCKCFMMVFDMHHQYFCVQPLEILDPSLSEKFEILVVGPELAYKDYIFTSLPVHSLRDIEIDCIAIDAMNEALPQYKYSAPLALNFLYLDWHFKNKKDCGKQSCFALDRKTLEVEKKELLKYANLHNKDAEFNYVHNEKDMDIVKKWSLEKESPVHSPRQSYSIGLQESACPNAPACDDKALEETYGECAGPLSRSLSRDLNSSKVQTIASKSLPNDEFACNDLTFFLRARRGTIDVDTVFKESKQGKPPEIQDSALFKSLTRHQTHEILLSESILNLKECLELDYLRILQNDAFLAHEIQQYKILHSLHTEADAKASLIRLIKEQTKSQNSSHEQQLLRGLIALYILQQTAENLCMYGIQVAHLYMESWYLNLRFLQDLVCYSYSESEEAYRRVEKGLLVDHPKLNCLGNIISKHKCKVHHPKILIIAERRALFTLYKKIISCNLKPYQFDREENLLQDGISNVDPDIVNQMFIESIQKCDCLMAAPEYIRQSFPIRYFSCIIHYGHFSADTEDFESCIRELDLEVHILKSTVKEHVSDIKLQHSEEVVQEVQSDDQGSNPIQETGERTVQKSTLELQLEASTANHTKPGYPATRHSIKQMDVIEHDKESAALSICDDIPHNPLIFYRKCEMNIVVNIHKVYDYLLSGRSSSYQQILKFEKHGMNVVERDLCLPIDMILSPKVCLLWYIKENFFLNETVTSQILTLKCMEGIINDVMKPLSFSFKTCIMIFEGQSEFIAEVMKTLGFLQAAAVGLNIHLQCFLSDSSSTTEMIINESILESKRLRKTTSFPAMPEAETLAESFLTSFASVNPLVAHAILSSGIELCHFMSLKVEEQLKLTEPFDLSEQSLFLFKQQAQSGKSGRSYKGTTHMNRSKPRCESIQEGTHLEKFVCPLQAQTRCMRKACRVQPGPNKESENDILLNEDLCLASKLDIKMASAYIDTNEDTYSYDSKFQSNIFTTLRNDDKRLKRTVDLILNKKFSRGPECTPNAAEVGNYTKSPPAHPINDCWPEIGGRKSPNTWLYSPVNSVLSPELEPQKTHQAGEMKTRSASGTVCARNPNLDTLLHSDFISTKLNLSPDHSQKHYLGIYSEQGANHGTNVDLEDIIDCESEEDTNKYTEKECPMEFANETRVHLKRKLDFGSPAVEMESKKCAWEQQERLKSMFDEYRHGGRKEGPSQAYFDGPRLQPRKTMDIRKSLITRRKMNVKSKSGLPTAGRASSCCSPSQSKGLGTSWTPYDKRSKKVYISFLPVLPFGCIVIWVEKMTH
ncbi:hypothetical protein KP509_12G041300 [Ceratopteris richardii]|uniref:Uncharacterized protein n=1 Tax=Ceratopteris richardii TaxID=49495 RepID=A0A8T2TMW0_CERRI|nr:hypothetical protein KP509_12G041300 [Ceratopteris richardii]KAH7423143.1 hypothetical protein KP509_12G041300 [Ceratopteris richardii]KAH7423147.1 hypothetical protein KP509_12G041300 [Ceratopteris richardii]